MGENARGGQAGAHSLATSTITALVVPEVDECAAERAIIRICDDVPDWSLYAWSNPTRVVYGPVSSRRLGMSLGINLFPQGKVCSFRCAYCDLDMAQENEQRARLVPTQQIITRIAADLPRYGVAERHPVDSITFAGNGEPTIHPGFSNVVEVVAQLRDEWLPDTPMNLFTDGMHLVNPAVRAATARFRRVFLKLDGAHEAVVERINGPGAWRGTLRAVAIGRQLPNVAASTALVAGPDANTADVKSRRFVEIIRELRPRELYLYTLDYPSPAVSIAAVDFDTLVEHAEWLARRVDCRVIALWRRHRHPTALHQDTHE